MPKDAWKRISGNVVESGLRSTPDKATAGRSTGRRMTPRPCGQGDETESISWCEAALSYFFTLEWSAVGTKVIKRKATAQKTFLEAGKRSPLLLRSSLIKYVLPCPIPRKE